VNRFWLSGLLMTAVAISPLCAAPAAWTESVLYSAGSIGTYLKTGVILGPSGKLYGEANGGGQQKQGTVFELQPPTGKATSWIGTVLHNFSGTDGSSAGAGLVSDKTGNLYGTRELGGRWGLGVVFELSPPAAGKTAWTTTVIHEFTGSDGGNPAAALTLDAAGNLYGTTLFGGTDNGGIVFKFTRPAAGKTAWAETVLHRFNDDLDGVTPFGGVIFDEAGNLYGTTADGGAAGEGTVYKLARPAAGQTTWTETVLHSFVNAGGSGPDVQLIFDAAGNLYGTAEFGGGLNSYGTVFKLTRPTAGKTAWTATVLHTFRGGADGKSPVSGLVLDKDGNLYGTAPSGGRADAGIVFKLTPPVAGKSTWVESLLYSFHGGSDGGEPGSIVFDAHGNLFGTASAGGASGTGVVFKLSPNS
jgi:uncharacterized repeat protein (TIGR03803 family)